MVRAISGTPCGLAAPGNGVDTAGAAQVVMETGWDMFKLILSVGTGLAALRTCRHVVLLAVSTLSLPLSALEITQPKEFGPTEDWGFQVDRQMRKASAAKTILDGLTDTSSGRFEKEVRCLALNIYFEARSEPVAGQRAVAHVVMNRVAHPGYPSSVCGVVKQGGEQRLHRCQFSWWCDGRSDKPLNHRAWRQSLRLARKIYLGTLQDTTDGALWYHAIYAAPYWSKLLLQGDRIGQHIFYLENRQARDSLL